MHMKASLGTDVCSGLKRWKKNQREERWQMD